MANMFEELGLDSESPSDRRARLLADSDAELIQNLIKIRTDNNISQDALAKRMGVTQATVASFERYDNDPKLSTIRRYSHAVGALVGHVVEADRGQLELGEWKVVAITVRPNVTRMPSRTYAVEGLKRSDVFLAA